MVFYGVVVFTGITNSQDSRVIDMLHPFGGINSNIVYFMKMRIINPAIIPKIIIITVPIKETNNPYLIEPIINNKGINIGY